MSFFRATWLVAAVAPLGACANGSTEPTACATFATALFVKDRMNRAASAFDVSEPITFELRVSNARNAPATLTASSSCTAVVFEVHDAAQQPRWGSADGIACIQMLQPRTFGPLETVSESAAWDQQGSDGARVPAGEYVVMAAVGQYAAGPAEIVDCRAELSKSATFRIR